MRLRVLPRADRQISAAKKWWAEHRDKAPQRFEEELADALEQVALEPELGPLLLLGIDRPIRRVLLRRTGYHLYYEVVANEVHILTLWRARRGRPPRLSS